MSWCRKASSPENCLNAKRNHDAKLQLGYLDELKAEGSYEFQVSFQAPKYPNFVFFWKESE